MGAWIEIQRKNPLLFLQLVAPLVGAWIEIPELRASIVLVRESLPSWERGLKFRKTLGIDCVICVAPPVGAWIEIV